MKLKQLFGTSSRTDDRGVSPVIGVALLIAITVTLVAVIGAVVMGIGPTASAPEAKMDFSTAANGSNYDVTLEHDGGDALNAEHVTVKTNGTTSHMLSSNTSAEFTAGDSATIVRNASVGTTVTLVWDDPDSDKSRVLAEMEIS